MAGGRVLPVGVDLLIQDGEGGEGEASLPRLGLEPGAQAAVAAWRAHARLSIEGSRRQAGHGVADDSGDRSAQHAGHRRRARVGVRHQPTGTGSGDRRRSSRRGRRVARVKRLAMGGAPGARILRRQGERAR